MAENRNRCVHLDVLRGLAGLAFREGRRLLRTAVVPRLHVAFHVLPIHRHYVAQHSAKMSMATNVAVFALSYLAILLIGCGVMKFWERVQAK